MLKTKSGAPSIGIMQGRLSPPVDGRIQAFPAGHWKAEFAIAKTTGYTAIEWIFETPMDENPLSSEAGAAEISDLIRQTGVMVNFICADYFMEVPFVRMSAETLPSNRRILMHLIRQAARIGAAGIEIPCVDASEIRSRKEEDELVAALSPCLDFAAEAGVQIGLETSLPPDRFRHLLERINHPAIRANYDSGNSASLGYDPAEEMAAYGRWINNVHIKDRIRGGGTVPLGNGDTDIPLVLDLLARAEYRGGFIIQGARGTDNVETARHYLDQVNAWLKALQPPTL